MPETLPIIDNRCGECVACCSFVGVPPFAQDEYEALPSELRKKIDGVLRDNPGWEMDGGDQGVCMWLSRDSETANGKCDNYEHRPAQCRDFGYWSPACLEVRFIRGYKDAEHRFDETYQGDDMRHDDLRYP